MLAEHGERQLHVAETEKYAHVTYFFNGGREAEWEEERHLVDSPRDVPTYDERPEMSARAAAEAFVERWQADGHRFGIINFANPDMVGHTGSIPAAVAAIEAVDGCLEVVAAVHGRGGACIVTADHGNAEQMLEPDGSPNTAHSLNPVPFVVTVPDVELESGGVLADVAPTALDLLGLEVPPAMTGARSENELDPYSFICYNSTKVLSLDQSSSRRKQQMALVRWEPAREVDSLQSEVNRVFDAFFGNGASRTRRWVPAMDLVETDSDLVLRADLPGLTRDDVEIEIKDGTLTVSGERKSQHEEKSEGYYRVERAFGRFSRSLTLPRASTPRASRPSSPTASSRCGSRSRRSASPTGSRSAPPASTARRPRPPRSSP